MTANDPRNTGSDLPPSDRNRASDMRRTDMSDQRPVGMYDRPTSTTSSSFWVALAVIVVLALIAVLLVVYVF